jgi:hypothetical protein
VKVIAAEPPESTTRRRLRCLKRLARQPQIRANAIPETRQHDQAPFADAEWRVASSGASRDDVAELRLETPVEMWFGDSRVGVRPGTPTYERFRKYADVLLSDLNESEARADNP